MKRKVKDKVIVFSSDKVDIYDVEGMSEESVITKYHVFPYVDAVQKINPEGGLYYVYNVDVNYLKECSDLKDIEESLVLKNMFNFGEQERKFDIKFFAMLAALIITIFILK